MFGAPNLSILNSITIGKFPEPGNAAQTVVYSREQLSAGYDFIDLMGKASHLVVNGDLSVEDYRYTNAQKLLNTVGVGLDVSGIVPLERKDDRNIWAFNFGVGGEYQNVIQFDDNADTSATRNDYSVQGSLGLSWSPQKDLSIGLYTGANYLYMDKSRQQTDILNGGTFSVKENHDNFNFYAGLYVQFSLAAATKPAAVTPVAKDAPTTVETPVDPAVK